ncbi:MAG: hypothetical protein IKR33_03645 [Bacteroidales bacterium]|nr:hypothetical protein [Bacteroidales bacterium]
MKYTNSRYRRIIVCILTTIALAPLAARTIAIILTTGNFGWPAYNYFIGYETGFGGRKLIGTVCNLLLPNIVRVAHIQAIVIVANVLLLALSVLFAAKCLKRVEAKPQLAFILAIYLIAPFSILEWFYTGMSVIFMETYQLIFVLVWLLLFINYHQNRWFNIVTILLVFVCVLIHHTFCCVLFPLVVALLVYEMFEGEQLSKRGLIWASSVCVATALLLASIWLFSRMNIPIDTLRARLDMKAEPGILTQEPCALEMLYYMSNSGNAIYNSDYLYNQKLLEFLMTVVLLSPLFAVLLFPMIYATQRTKKSPLKWRYIIMCIVLIFFPLPIFFLATDYGRWFTGWLFCLLATTCVMNAIHDRYFNEASAKLYSFFKCNYWLALLLVVWLGSLHTLSFEGLNEAILARKFLSI